MSYQETAEGVRTLLILEKMQQEGTLHTKIDQILKRAALIYRQRPERATPGYTQVIEDTSDFALWFTDLYKGLVTAGLEEPPPGRERGKVCLIEELYD